MPQHPIAPVWDARSRILILGSFPSVRSREVGFYYGHPQNRFWRVLAALWEEAVPQSREEKTAFLLRHRIALWDVIASCEIEGSADSSIRDVQPNDLTPILRGADIRCICTNGTTAEALFRRHLAAQTAGIPRLCLPSTSPANARVSLPALTERWQIVRTEAERE